MAKFNEKELHAIEVARRAIEDVKESEPEMIPYGQARLVRVIVATYNRVVFHGEYRGIKDRLRAELCALRPEIMHNPCISKTQKLAVWGITAFPALYNIPLFVRWCYRKRNRNV